MAQSAAKMTAVSKKMGKRLLSEQKAMRRDMADEQVGVGAEPTADLRHWRSLIEGPADTPFEGGFFELSIKFPRNYPFAPPKIKFEHAVFHPNVYKSNDICLDILANQWSPSYRIDGVLKSIRSLLNDPNVNSPANVDASKAYNAWRHDNSDTQYADRVRATMKSAGRYRVALPEWYTTVRRDAREEAQRRADKKRKRSATGEE